MKQLRRIFLFTNILVLIIGISSSIFIGGIIDSTKVSAVSMTDPDAPKLNEEVGWWISRSEIMLFNNTTTKASDAHGTIFRNKRVGNGDGSYPSGGYSSSSRINGAISMSASSIEVYQSTDLSSCELTVTFAAFNRAPSSGTLSSSCPNTTKSVKLKKNEKGIIDAHYATRGSNNGITMALAVQHLSGCGNSTGGTRIGGDNSDGYSRNVTFKEDDGESANGQSYDYKADNAKAGSSDHMGISISGSRSARPIIAKQFTWCPDDNKGRADYGAIPGGDWSGGADDRAVYVSVIPLKDEQDEADREITGFHTAKLKVAEFIKFFENPTNAKKANDCYILSFNVGSISDTTAVDIAIKTLTEPRTGPYSECLYRIFEDSTEFDRIDGLQAEGATRPPDPVGGSGDDCGGTIPIISDLVCGLTKWLFNTIFEIFTGVIEWMAQPPDMFAEQNSTLEQSMKNLRNVANILFVFAFLMVVFQYLTNVNVVDAYFIKKFIPRLVIAVILVQASFWITSELNYFFYDLGRSIQSIIFAGQEPGSLQMGDGAATVALFLGPNIIGILLVLGLVMLVVLLITLIILAIRYVLIIVLAIFAPIAFACLAIPQLEGITKKWFKMYVQLLMMYPIMMLFIAASSIIGGVFAGGGTMMQIMGLVVQILPFIILPFTFKFAGGIMGGISAKLMNKGTSMAKGKGKEAYGNSQFGMERAKQKEFKKGIKSDRAGNAAAEKFTKKMQSPMSKYGKMRTYGAGASDQEISKYQGIFSDKEEKRKSDEASAALASKLRGTPTRPINDRADAVSLLNDEYHSAMGRGDVHTANAAYAGLVKQQAEGELRQIQTEANQGSFTDGAGNTHTMDSSVYNKQQGDNYGDIKAFAPHLTGDVGGMPPTALAAQRAKNLSDLSDDSLAGVKPEAWEQWSKVDPTAAAARYVSIAAKGGGSAAKLAPTAKAKLVADPSVSAAINMSDTDIASNFAGMPPGTARDDAVNAAKAERDIWKKHLT